MIRTRRLFALLLAAAAPAYPCTSFVLDGKSGLVVGRNLDHPDDKTVPGSLIVNPRGISKRALPENPGDPASMEWTSKYGSVTFTFAGREFADGGMNEAGLVIEEMSLHADQRLPEKPGAIRMQRSQWIQRQLDLHCTVAEVAADLEKAVPTGGWHYLVADAEGEVAVIEIFKGKLEVHQGEALEMRVLANDPYPSCVRGIKEFEGFGGKRPVPPGGAESWKRFVRGAKLVAASPAKPAEAPMDEAFEILRSVSIEGMTKRSIVHDIAGRRIMFRTSGNDKVRWVSLAKLDLAKDRLCLACDLNDAKLSGDLAAHLKPWTPESDRPIYDYLRSIVGKGQAEGEPLSGLLDRMQAHTGKSAAPHAGTK